MKGFELIGLLLDLAIQGPFAFSESGNCKRKNDTSSLNNTYSLNNSNNDSTSTSNEEKNNSDDLLGPQKYAILAVIISCFFALGNMLLIIFVDEKGI